MVWRSGRADGLRLPLTIGPAIAALGLALYARPGIGGTYRAMFFPAVVVLAFGMAITVAPLTTTVMSAVDPRHAGAASGVNNAVARVAALLAIAVIGVVLAGTFEARVRPALDRLALSSAARQEVDQELPRMAGADLAQGPALLRRKTSAWSAIIDDAFVFAFRLVIVGAAALAFAAAAVGGAIGQDVAPR